MMSEKRRCKYNLYVHKGIKCVECNFIAHTHKEIDSHFGVGINHNFTLGDLKWFFNRLDIKMDKVRKKEEPEKVVFT